MSTKVLNLIIILKELWRNKDRHMQKSTQNLDELINMKQIFRNSYLWRNYGWRCLSIQKLLTKPWCTRRINWHTWSNRRCHSNWPHLWKLCLHEWKKSNWFAERENKREQKCLKVSMTTREFTVIQVYYSKNYSMAGLPWYIYQLKGYGLIKGLTRTLWLLERNG